MSDRLQPLSGIMQDYFGNDFKYASMIFGLCIKESLPEMYKWDELLEQKGATQLGARAHALRPVIEMTGLSSLSSKCMHLEKACKYGEETDLLVQRVAEIKNEIEKTEPLLEEQYMYINKMISNND